MVGFAYSAFMNDVSVDPSDLVCLGLFGGRFSSARRRQHRAHHGHPHKSSLRPQSVMLIGSIGLNQRKKNPNDHLKGDLNNSFLGGWSR